MSLRQKFGKLFWSKQEGWFDDKFIVQVSTELDFQSNWQSKTFIYLAWILDQRPTYVSPILVQESVRVLSLGNWFFLFLRLSRLTRLDSLELATRMKPFSASFNLFQVYDADDLFEAFSSFSVEAAKRETAFVAAKRRWSREDEIGTCVRSFDLAFTCGMRCA